MASLQDQLLKAGLTTKQKARQANSDKRKKNKQKRSGAHVEESMQEQAKQSIAQQKAEKQAKDAALNEERKKALEAKELHQRVSQILSHHHIKEIDGEIEYNYTFDNKIKKLMVNEQTQKALVNGRLSICGLDETTYVVTAETADKLSSLMPDVVLLKNEKAADADIDEDDPYAEFQIPDDLMW
ncbi:DUF2058 domain-containing protein [Thalassotalea euphylliae]|uniref:DUF2058 domain-containing protein n=1 Tax=Thalassotalea euphylliae TaxID=1655234 RepID=UPI00362D53F4